MIESSTGEARPATLREPDTLELGFSDAVHEEVKINLGALGALHGACQIPKSM